MKAWDLRPEEKERLFAFVTRTLPDELRGDAARLQAFLETKLMGHEALAHQGICEMAKARMQVPGATAEDFRERVVRLEYDRFFIAGIRFGGHDVDRAYVRAWFPFGPDVDDLEIVRAAALAEFAVFKPENILWESFDSDIPDEIELRDVFIGADLPLGGPPKELPAGCEILVEAGADFYPEYIEAYEDWREENAPLAKYVTAEKPETLKEAALKGRLVSLFIDGKWSGCWGARFEDFYGRHAVYVFEKFLTKDARGKGLSSAFDQAAIRSLGSEFDYLWGSIHTRNTPSLRSALATGRHPVGAEWLLRLR